VDDPQSAFSADDVPVDVTTEDDDVCAAIFVGT
jgi:hypothetical protein